MKRIAAVLSATALGASLALVAAPAHAAGPYCGIRWGSTPEHSSSTGAAGELTGVRAGRHACFDRLVLDVEGDAGELFVRYVDQVRQDGSGEPVPLRGGARLEVVLQGSVLATDAWFGPNGELLDARGYRTFRHLAWAGHFEGQSTLGLGVRARLPFRTFVLDGPADRSRVVVDVAHRW